MLQKNFSARVIKWFDQHGRHNLPWQKNPTPYRVWLSEIMLQQTQVSTVIPYFKRFTQQFPTIKSLAAAHIDEVLSLWAGLGYYARARHLHKTATIIQEKHHGRMPRNLNELCELPGIGRSTAGAILSFAMRQVGVILDGNVKRVLARHFAITSPTSDHATLKELWEIALKLTPSESHQSYNQAMMDLGATLCARSKPLCESCPLARTCQANKLNLQNKIPAPKKRAQRPEKSVYMLLLQNQHGEILLQKRPPVGIWGGLWSFPECPSGESPVDFCKKQLGLVTEINQRWPELLHQFTHFQLKIKPIVLLLKSKSYSNSRQNLTP